MEFQSPPEQQWRSGFSLTQSHFHQYIKCIVRTAFLIFSTLVLVKGYQWLKERLNSEEGRRQLAKIKELHLLADRLGCTAAQLAIGTTLTNKSIRCRLCSFHRCVIGCWDRRYPLLFFTCVSGSSNFFRFHMYEWVKLFNIFVHVLMKKNVSTDIFRRLFFLHSCCPRW